MIITIKNNLAYVIAVAAIALTAGTVAMAQSYSWIPLGSIASSWSINGAHIYNSNAGSVVIGGLNPDGTLLLDVAGQIGAAGYCDETGTSTSCFVAADMKWTQSGNVQYNTNSGNVGIGESNPSQKLDVNGNVLADAYFYSSDRRLKDNIQTVLGMDIIRELNGVSFDWIEDGSSTLGLIAQDVEQVLPQLVHTDEDGFKSVEYAGLIAPLIEAVKEQQTEIDALRALLEEVQN